MKKCVFLFLLPFALLTACKAKKEYPIKSKYYDITIFRSSGKNDPAIFGNFKEFGTQYPIPIPVVKYLPDKPFIKGDAKGNYKFSVKPESIVL